MKKPNTVQNQPLNSKNILSNLDKNKNDLKKLTKLIMVAISKTKETGAIVNSMAADVFKLLDSPSTGKQNTQIYKEQLHSMMRDQNKNIEYIGSLLTKFTLIENQIAEQEKCVERISSENIATQELELSDVHIISVDGTSFKRYLEVAKVLKINLLDFAGIIISSKILLLITKMIIIIITIIDIITITILLLVVILIIHVVITMIIIKIIIKTVMIIYLMK